MVFLFCLSEYYFGLIEVWPQNALTIAYAVLIAILLFSALFN